MPGNNADVVTAKQDHTVVYKNSVMSAGLGNLDLGHMVNGCPCDPIELYVSPVFCKIVGN